MANPKHLAMLEKGVAAWNSWREKNPGVRPNLTEANLREAYLREANLVGANLSEADLREANLFGADLNQSDLRRANLYGAHLFRANLFRADLGWANLGWANLGWANLGWANLSGADLSNADLIGAYLRDADLTAATMGFTTLGDLNLRQVKGLETVEHRGPSTIGLDTIYRSGGDIPPEFLRGAGVPEDFIAYMRSLVNNPIEYYSCFISYNSQDEECAQRLYADLQAKGVRCWFAPHDIKIGDDILDRIDETIRARDKLLLILSRNSIQSGWVETEVKTAFEEERRRKKDVLFPVRLDDEVLNTTEPWAAQLRRKFIGDFTRWKEHDAYQEGLARLLRDLKASAKA